MEVTFQVTSHEGSVIVSCETSLELGLIQTHGDFDVVPDSGSLIYSKTDPLVKQKYKKSDLVSKLRGNVHSREMQPPPVSRVKETEVNQCVKEKVPIQDEIGKQKCKANAHDKNCQITNMQPLKPQMDM